MKLGPGSVFGDFSEIKGKVYKPQSVIAMSETLKCIMISNSDLKALFAKILTPENFNIVRGQIPVEILSLTAVKKISRCFTELEFPVGHEIMTEGQ